MNRTIKSILAIITASTFAFCVSVMAQGKGGGAGGAATGATTGAQNAGGPAQIQPVTDGAANTLNTATSSAGDKNPDKKNMGASGGADKQPLGADKQPLGADKQPLGADKQPLGADKQPLGADKQPLDGTQATRTLNSATSGGKKVPDKKEMGANDGDPDKNPDKKSMGTSKP